MDDKKMIENYKSRVKRQNEKAKENYDRISVMLPKGTKDRIQAQGLTINGFVNQLVLDKLDELEKNNSECPFWNLKSVFVTGFLLYNIINIYVCDIVYIN